MGKFKELYIKYSNLDEEIKKTINSYPQEGLISIYMRLKQLMERLIFGLGAILGGNQKGEFLAIKLKPI